MSRVKQYNELLNQLKQKGPSAPCTIIYGEEDYLKKVAVSRIEEFIGTKRISFFGQDSRAEDIKREISNTGLFAEKKLIVVYEFEKLKNRNELLKLNIPSDTNLILILSSSCDKKKKRDILSKVKAKPNIQRIEFSILELDGFKIWVKSRLKKYDKHVDERTFNLLLDKLPHNLTAADKELEKLFLFMGDDTIVDEKYLSILSDVTHTSLPASLTKHMGYEKKHAGIIWQFVDVERNNQLLYTLETHFVRMQDVRLGTFFSDRYRSTWKLNPYKRNKMLHTLKDSACVFQRLLNIEYATKTSLHNEKITKGLIILSLLP